MDADNINPKKLLEDDKYLREILDGIDHTKTKQVLVNEFSRNNKKLKRYMKEYMSKYSKLPAQMEYRREYAKLNYVKQKANTYQRKRRITQVDTMHSDMKPIYDKIVKAAAVIKKQRDTMEVVAREHGYANRKEFVQRKGLIDKILFMQEVLNKIETGNMTKEEQRRVDRFIKKGVYF